MGTRHCVPPDTEATTILVAGPADWVTISDAAPCNHCLLAGIRAPR